MPPCAHQRRPRRGHIVGLLAAAATVLAGADARADPSPEDAAKSAELKRQGDRAMETMHYPEALDAYGKSYEISHEPALLYNRGRALQLLGRYPEALEELEKFQHEASPELALRVPTLAKLVAEVKTHVSSIRVSCNVDGARVLARDVAVGVTPIQAPVRLITGHAAIEVLAEGYLPFRKEYDLEAGAVVDLSVNLVAKASAGVLAVTSTQPGSIVLVDGESLGVAPLETTLNAGNHRIVLNTDGFEDTETTAVVKSGARTDVRLSPSKPASLLSQWWFWTAVGGAIVGGVVVTYAVTRERPADTGTFGPGRAAAPLWAF
jgi:hypothetical protein